MANSSWPGSRAVFRLIMLGGLAIGLSACGSTARMDRPAQVEERGAVPPPAPDSGAQVAAYRPPAPPRVARPAPNRAVAVLTQRADDQRRTGDLDGATVSLERALRITPDDADLWHRLAQVRLAQQRHDLVVQLAAKSNALATAQDYRLRSDNWQLIAQARRALGDSAGAAAAQRHADSLR